MVWWFQKIGVVEMSCRKTIGRYPAFFAVLRNETEGADVADAFFCAEVVSIVALDHGQVKAFAPI